MLIRLNGSRRFMKGSFVLYFMLFLSWSCSPNSLEDFQKEGKAHSNQLLQELQSIHNYQDLLKKEQVLKKRFEKLADLMIEARVFLDRRKSTETSYPSEEDYFLSDQLKVELTRIYSMEGGRELIERAEREAMLKLDAFEKKRLKHKELKLH